MDKRYADRVQLLVDVLPALDGEPRFALKGGTAINLFEHDLPRLSVDIDVTWLPTQDFETDSREIEAALGDLSRGLKSRMPQLQINMSRAQDATHSCRIIAQRGRARVQIETTPVMRGTVHPIRRVRIQPGVERQFGFAEVQVVHFNDLYAGKIAAALSRQHPRDLFDIDLLLRRGPISSELWRTFLVYLTASPKPAADILLPSPPADFDDVFRTQFSGMTTEPVSAEALLDARQRLLNAVAGLMDHASRSFLESVETETPRFDLIGLPSAASLPAVRWKLGNLAKRSDEKRAADRTKLLEGLQRLAADARKSAQPRQ